MVVIAYISINYFYLDMNEKSCDPKTRAYKNGKTFEECKEEAIKISDLLSKDILAKGEITWTYILEVTGHDELVYKLTLKYLRQKGYDIGNNTIPRVKII